MRFTISAIWLVAVACGGGGGDPVAPNPPVAPDPGPAAPAPTPLPSIDADVIGKPGDPVPGLSAYYVTTMLGWLAPEGDVIFEAVIQWKPDNTLGCGILRRAPEGHVHPLLMQGQPLPGTGGAVKHPKLPIESRGDVLIMPADVEGGAIDHGLFAVPRAGGTPTLLAEGRFAGATVLDDGTVIAQREDDGAIVRIPTGGSVDEICPGCAPGFSTDGERVVVRRLFSGAWVIDADGSVNPILLVGDAAPGTGGDVTRVRGAWVNDAGAFVLHVDTSDEECPEALLRFAGGVEVLAVCGGPAPGTQETIERIRVASGRSEDVVFAAGTTASGAIVYCARPDRDPEPVAFSGPLYRIREAEVVVDGPQIAFGASSVQREAVFRVAPGTGPEEVLFTDAVIPAAGGARLVSFPEPLAVALDVAADGRTLAHAGLVEERRPDATLGALLLMR